MNQPTRDRIDILDGLRGVAILLVLGLHFWELSWWSQSFAIFGHQFTLDFITTSGFIGVELFFFLSGFCLFHPLTRNHSNFNWVHYWRRRFFKIVPSYLLCIAILAVAFKVSSHDIITHLLFIHTLWPETYASINGVLWSLGIEVQFYCIFPIIVWFYRRYPIITSILVWGIANAYRWYWGFLSPTNIDSFSLNQLPGFMDFFLGGIVAADISSRLRGKLESANVRLLISLVAIASIAWFLALLYNYYEVRYQISRDAWLIKYRPWFVLNFLIMTLSLQYSNAFLKKVIANSMFQFMATISYNFYIWHQIIGRKLVEWKIPAYFGNDPHDDSTWQWQFFLFATIGSVLVAWTITRFFEQPILKRA
jgi:peptidoglycan/LPS O-acetylase OafA/YrhL